MGAARCAATAVAEAAWYMVVEAATRERFDSRGEGSTRSEVAFAEELHEVAERAVDGVVPGAGEGVFGARAEDGLVRLVTRTRGEGVSESSDRTSAATSSRTTVNRREAGPLSGLVLVANLADAARGRGSGTETCPRGWMWSSRGSAARFGGWGEGVRVASRRGGRRSTGATTGWMAPRVMKNLVVYARRRATGARD